MNTASKNERCSWCHGDSDYIQYHDTEWGVPQEADNILFEFLILESFQAGLSWITILKKREAFRKAFAKFDIQKVAHFTEHDIENLMANKDIVRNRRKITAARNNAECFLQVQKDYGTFAHYLWSFVDFQQKQNAFRTEQDVPATTTTAKILSADMKKKGFTFVGPTIMYAYMQAVGLVNDHVITCPRHKEIAQKAKGIKFGVRG